MYMVLSWSVISGEPPSDIEQEINAAIDAHQFVNVFEVFDTHIIANVDKSATSDELILLANELNSIASGRFTFIMYMVPKGNFARFSSDLDSSADTLDDIARF